MGYGSSKRLDGENEGTPQLLDHRGGVGPLRKVIQGRAQRPLKKGRPSWRMKSRNLPALCKVLEYPTGSRLDAYLKRIRNFKDHGETCSDGGPTGASPAQPRTLKVGKPLNDTQTLERAQAKVADPHRD